MNKITVSISDAGISPELFDQLYNEHKTYVIISTYINSLKLSELMLKKDEVYEILQNYSKIKDQITANIKKKYPSSVSWEIDDFNRKEIGIVINN